MPRFDRSLSNVEREIYGNIKRFIYRERLLHLLPCIVVVARGDYNVT